MRVMPQANITDGTGTTILVKTAAQARKVLTSTARLHGRAITVKQHGYDPGNPAAGGSWFFSCSRLVLTQRSKSIDQHFET